MEVVRASLFGMHMPRFYWGEAVKSAIYIINRVPSRVINFQTPHQKLQSFFDTPHHPNLEPRTFGCTVYVHIPKVLRNKLDPCAQHCVFIGYSDFQKGYRCYCPQTRKLHVSLDVSFRETTPYYLAVGLGSPLQGENVYAEDELCRTMSDNSEGNGVFMELETFEKRMNSNKHNAIPLTDTQTIPNEMILSLNNDLCRNYAGDIEAVNHNGENTEMIELGAVGIEAVSLDEEDTTMIDLPAPSTTESSAQNILDNSTTENTSQPTPRYSQRSNKGVSKKQYEPDIKTNVKYPINNYVSSHRLSESYALTINQLSKVSIPSNVQDALADPRWKKAMNEEMEALQKNSTWELIVLPEGKKAIGCRWVYTVKLKADGSIDRYKARLVAKGYAQKYGIDYQETFAPVAKFNTIRILISIAANRDWPLQQFDVKNAFLNGDLEEEVYMELPPGINQSSKHEDKVCKLKRSLYGLKQSPRAWFGRFTLAMKAAGYQQSNADHTLFVKHKDGRVTTLIVYVDDMILTGDDPEEMKTLREYLSAEFEMKDLGQLKYFLGIEVARSKQGISLSQHKYVLDLLSETGMLACKPVETPIQVNHRLGIFPDQVPTDMGRYQRLVGKLIYLTHTRPDITYAVSVVSQFMHAPSEEHMDAVYRILRYLKGAPGKGLLYSKNDISNIEGYTDADWAGDQTIRRSTSGYLTFVEGNLITWRSKKQKVVARSSAEAEFRGMAQGICELLWIKSILKDLEIKYTDPINLYCDNKAAIQIAHNPVQHDRTKHVEVDRHFIKEKLDQKIICFPFVKSASQLADILTKAISNKDFYSMISKLGMIDIYAPT